MKRLLLRDVQELRILDLIKYACRISTALGFGMVLALTAIYIRFAEATRHEDQSCQYSVIRLTGENEELRLAVAEMQKKAPEIKLARKK